MGAITFYLHLQNLALKFPTIIFIQVLKHTLLLPINDNYQINPLCIETVYRSIIIRMLGPECALLMYISDEALCPGNTFVAPTTTRQQALAVFGLRARLYMFAVVHHHDHKMGQLKPQFVIYPESRFGASSKNDGLCVWVVLLHLKVVSRPRSGFSDALHKTSVKCVTTTT